MGSDSFRGFRGALGRDLGVFCFSFVDLFVGEDSEGFDVDSGVEFEGGQSGGLFGAGNAKSAGDSGELVAKGLFHFVRHVHHLAASRPQTSIN